MSLDTDRLYKLFTEEYVIKGTKKDLSLLEYVNDRCFAHWKHRGKCIDIYDYLEVLDFDSIVDDAHSEINALLTLIELIYNFWSLAEIKIPEDTTCLYAYPNFYYLKDYMINSLSQYNHVAVVRKNEQMVLVIEDKPEVTAASEISDAKIAVGILKYNHHSLKGDIDAKKTILLSLASELEPRRADLHNKNKDIEKMIFFMLNNLDIRHNNRKREDKNYREYVARMRKSTLEKWYDELYQLILLAFLELDNVKRMEELEKLKTMICP